MYSDSHIILPFSIFALHLRFQSLHSRILVVWKVFQRRYHIHSCLCARTFNPRTHEHVHNSKASSKVHNYNVNGGKNKSNNLKEVVMVSLRIYYQPGNSTSIDRSILEYKTMNYATTIVAPMTKFTRSHLSPPCRTHICNFNRLLKALAGSSQFVNKCWYKY